MDTPEKGGGCSVGVRALAVHSPPPSPGGSVVVSVVVIGLREDDGGGGPSWCQPVPRTMIVARCLWHQRVSSAPFVRCELDGHCGDALVRATDGAPDVVESGRPQAWQQGWTMPSCGRSWRSVIRGRGRGWRGAELVAGGGLPRRSVPTGRGRAGFGPFGGVSRPRPGGAERCGHRGRSAPSPARSGGS